LQKKFAATLTIAIFLISTFAIVAPAQAHFTLGNLSGQSPYDVTNFDPHVAGPIGYVWPGSGENAYAGFPNVASDNLNPGYQSPYPNSKPPGAPSNSWYQLEANTYAPFGAVLTDSTGDLIFALNATCPSNLWNPDAVSLGYCATQRLQPQAPLDHTLLDNGVTKSEIQTPIIPTAEWTTWIILIPPEFTVPGATTRDPSQIVSTLSNSYSHYLIAKLSPDDRYAPGWTMVAITADGTTDFGNSGPYYWHQFIEFTNAGEWYYARINGVTAPSTAGKYFFKMALYSGNDYYGVGPTLAGEYSTPFPLTPAPFVWVPPQNWPVMLVKGETDPAIITGTLRYAGYNATLYQHPIGEAGRVWAHMTMRIDPYTGLNRPDLQTVDGQAFVNATANGHYELEGLAPGVYDIYAEAAGYPQTLCTSAVTLLKGQSLHFDCYLQPGPVIHGNVFTKHQFGDEPWPGNSTIGQYMKIELYSNPTLSNLVDVSAGSPVSWSPLPCVAGGQEQFLGRGAAGLCGDPRDGSALAFPWHEYSTVSGPAYNDPIGLFTGTTNGYSRDVAIGVCSPAQFPFGCVNTFPTGTAGSELGVDNLLASDPEGVGPPQHWFVNGGTTTAFHFEFGLKGEYGAPRDLSGEVPQVYATWINGLTPGRYYVRAWTFRYVQTAVDGSTFEEYSFDVTPNEWAGDVTLPIDLRLSSWVNKTVYFHDEPNTTVTSPIHSGAGFMWGNLLGADGHVYAHNVTGLGLLETRGTGSASGSPYYYYPLGCFSYDQYGYNAGGSDLLTNLNQFQTGEFGAPSISCPYGSGPGQEVSALDKAGLNANSIATGRATIQFWGINDTWGGENYGIPSGTYMPNVGVNGYYSPTAEQVSVTLSGSPISISDHLFLGPGFNVTVTSVDWERPRVSRNWVWSGCQYSVFSFCAGSEIDVGWYPVLNGTAGTLADYFGAEPTFMPVTVPEFQPGGSVFGGLYQGPGGTDCVTGLTPSYTCAEMDGGGRNVLPGYGIAHDAYFGQPAEYAYQGGWTAGLLGLLTAPALMLDPMFTTPILVLPLHFSEGQYNLAAYTYGYIQDKDYTAYAMNGQVADMKINLLIGVNVTLDILFKKENIITGTPYNMSARVRLFNDQGQLVAEWMSSEGTYVDRTGHAIAANGQLPAAGGLDAVGSYARPLYPFNNLWTVTSSNLNGYNFLPGGVTLLHVLMAGLPQQPPYASFFPFPPVITGTYFGDPVATGMLPLKTLGPLGSPYGPAPYGGCDFQIGCYPAAYGQYPFANTGIVGAPDYTGGWTAEVDFVPWYANNTACTLTLLDTGSTILDISNSYFHPNKFCFVTVASIGSGSISPADGAFTFVGTEPEYYPPVDGLLMGESYHIIPGTTATSGISLTEDMALDPNFLGHSLAANHLGPYSQQGVWQISNAHLSGEASGIFEVDQNGFVSGNVLAFTWSNEFRTLSWGTITVTGASGAAFPFYTYDGIYQAFLTPGQYTFTLSEPGYAPQTWTYSVSAGQSGTGANVYLEQSNIPVPEFSAYAIIAFSALGASVIFLRRRRK
jgi:hypothetical protein